MEEGITEMDRQIARESYITTMICFAKCQLPRK
jgi:hypothetical protein